MRITRLLRFIVYLQIITLLNLGAGSTAKAMTAVEAENSCSETLWIAVVSAPTAPELSAASTGFVLTPRVSARVIVPKNWTGLVWARTRCDPDPAFFHCLTGDCHSGTVACPRGTPPFGATVAHFMAASGGQEYYNEVYVSAEAGYNLAVAVNPVAGIEPRCGKAVLDERPSADALTSPTFVCCSATYHVHFCAVSHSVNMAEKSKGHNGKKARILRWALSGGFGGVGIVAVMIWWCLISDGCCNNHTFNFFYRSNQTSTIINTEHTNNIEVRIQSRV